MICFPCVRVDCENQPDVNLYNLQAGLNFSSPLLSFIVSCPANMVCAPGTFPRTITYPPGTWFIVTPPVVPPGYVLRLTGCSSEVVRVVPAGATAAQIEALAQEVIAEVAAQQAQCDALLVVPPPTPQEFSNQIVYFPHPCADGEDLQYTGTLPPWITVDIANSRLVGAAGFFIRSTQAAANLAAQTALNTFGNNAVASGDLDCAPEYDCAGVVTNIDDAVWVSQLNTNNAGSGSGVAAGASGSISVTAMGLNPISNPPPPNGTSPQTSVTLITTLCNPTGNPISLQFSFTGSMTFDTPDDVVFPQGGTLGVGVDVAGPIWTPYTIDTTPPLTSNPYSASLNPTKIIPPFSTVSVIISLNAVMAAFTNEGYSCSGSITFSIVQV